ncbi:hypothetical protein [Proteiniphilum sp.]|uniref:hypothetical protein n=1 Tax=Proteiniphilum sp. TaxID=1926877 RepID=UPI00332FF4DF
MKKKHYTLNWFQQIPTEELTLIKEGEKEDEYITVIIEGVEYRIRIGKNGEHILIPESVI